MALKKEISLGGVTLNYHRINDVIVDYRRLTTLVILASYVSEDTRSEDVNFVFKTEQFSFNKVDMTRFEIYTAIKENENWLDAINA
jgi:hypothetical protein